MNICIRNSIVFTLLMILIVQAFFLPISVVILFAFALITLYLRFAKKQKRISKVITFSFVILSLLATYLSYKTFLGIEAGVAVLATFLFAKAMEINAKRDVIILFNFALFVSASSFLYSQTLWVAVLVICCLISCLIGLYRLQTSEFLESNLSKNNMYYDAQHVGKFVLYAVPFFILLFLFFPRLPPLWHIPIPDSNKGVTGISDTMSPGDIAQLSQSSELAFRIIGNMSDLPDQADLYWRGLVLDQYDGQQWTSNFANQQPILNKNLDVNIESFDYQYLAADARTRWVMALEKSIPIQDRYTLRTDWSVVPQRSNARIQPVQMKWLNNKPNTETTEIPSWVKSSNTRLPNHLDLQAQQFAHELFVKSNEDPEEYIQNVLKWYKENNFTYTLSPGLLGQNRVDEFLFKSKQGFCEHYASSFVMLMRYVGIPARVVVGYQGGQLAPDGESWEVRQLDAHAWTEVLIGQNWVRFDPTAMIAPERIDGGMQNLMANNQRVFGDNNTQWKYKQFTLLNKVRIWGDYITYQWQSKVVGYDVKTQQNWFSRIGLTNTYGAVFVLILGILAVVALYFSWIYYIAYKRQDPIQFQLHYLSRQLPKDLQKMRSESVVSWLNRVAEHLELRGEHLVILNNFIHDYQQHMFGFNRYDKDVQSLLKQIKYCSNVFLKHKKGLS